MTQSHETHTPVSLKTEQKAIRPHALRRAVSSMLGMPVLRAEYQATPLHGGTLGDVQLVTGTAETAEGRTLPYRIVLKTQKQWQRPGDPHSWRREYDLYRSDFAKFFTDSFRWPKCYYTEIYHGENRIWMEYVEGTSGTNLTPEHLKRAALALGRFQGRCHQQSEALRRIPCLGDNRYLQRDFAQWTPETVEYRYLRSSECALPERLQQLLINTLDGADDIFHSIYRLPQVLCHRDYWTENIIVQNSNIVVLDWDCAGWGAIGEDIASLVADETDAAQIGEYYQHLVPAYYKGLSEAMDLPPINAIPIRQMILLKFGYRLLQQVMFSKVPEPKAEAILALEQIGTLR